MKNKWLMMPLALLMTMSAVACNGSGGESTESKVDSSESVSSETQTLTNVDVAAGYTRYDITENNGRKTTGFGAQFDTLIVEPQNGLSDDEWVNIQVAAIKETNLQCVRVRFFPECYERRNDNNNPYVFDYDSENVDFESAEMKQYYKLFDAFEENGVQVDLSWYGCRTTFVSVDKEINGSWLGGVYGQNGVNIWSVEPSLGEKPEEEFAESVAACLKYLVEVKKYTCVNEYSIFPEPDSMLTSSDMLGRISEDISARLEEMGLKDKFIYSGPADYGNNAALYEEKYLSKYNFEKATSSVYPFNATTDNEVMLEYAKKYTAVTDKYNLDWAIAECGTSNFIDPVHNKDSETYDRALFMARFMVNMMNGGCTGMKYFVFSDCYYDGALNKLGLFCYRHEGWAAKPVFYSWGMVMKYTDIGSEIYPVESSDPDINMVAFKLPDGTWSYMITNNLDTTKKIAVVNARADRAGKMNVYKLTEARLPENRELKMLSSSEEVDTSNGVAYVTLPAKSFVVVSNKGI